MRYAYNSNRFAFYSTNFGTEIRTICEILSIICIEIVLKYVTMLI